MSSTTATNADKLPYSINQNSVMMPWVAMIVIQRLVERPDMMSTPRLRPSPVLATICAPYSARCIDTVRHIHRTRSRATSFCSSW